MKLIRQQLFYIEYKAGSYDGNLYVEANSIEEATEMSREYMKQRGISNYRLFKVSCFSAECIRKSTNY